MTIAQIDWERIHRDLAETKEAVDRGLERARRGEMGSARVHLEHALTVLDRLIGWEEFLMKQMDAEAEEDDEK